MGEKTLKEGLKGNVSMYINNTITCPGTIIVEAVEQGILYFR